ncbi:Metallo-dependent phosphatase [Amanita muscaria]
MVLVLTIGDLHIPHREHDLPAKFKKLLVPGKIQQILCTGNVCDRETYEYLRTVSPDVCVARGDYDEVRTPIFPYSITVTHGPIRIGIIHGHQAVPNGDLDALSSIARQMDVDVLVSGHTHVFQAVEYDGRFFINPGSATGAWTGAYTTDATPSFALLDIQGPIVVTYVYQLVEGEVRVEKIEWRKDTDPTLSQSRPPPPGTAVAVPSLPSGPGVSAASGASGASSGGGSASPTEMVSPPPAAASVWG